jgi:hypothetical protein
MPAYEKKNPPQPAKTNAYVRRSDTASKLPDEILPGTSRPMQCSFTRIAKTRSLTVGRTIGHTRQQLRALPNLILLPTAYVTWSVSSASSIHDSLEQQAPQGTRQKMSPKVRDCHLRCNWWLRARIQVSTTLAFMEVVGLLYVLLPRGSLHLLPG